MRSIRSSLSLRSNSPPLTFFFFQFSTRSLRSAETILSLLLAQISEIPLLSESSGSSQFVRASLEKEASPINVSCPAGVDFHLRPRLTGPRGEEGGPGASPTAAAQAEPGPKRSRREGERVRIAIEII